MRLITHGGAHVNEYGHKSRYDSYFGYRCTGSFDLLRSAGTPRLDIDLPHRLGVDGDMDALSTKVERLSHFTRSRQMLHHLCVKHGQSRLVALLLLCLILAFLLAAYLIALFP
jgi:hypothetical protein